MHSAPYRRHLAADTNRWLPTDQRNVMLFRPNVNEGESVDSQAVECLGDFLFCLTSIENLEFKELLAVRILHQCDRSCVLEVDFRWLKNHA
jgi:hypothetical protein